jgi:N-acetylglucosamine-6-phosphate deacetylase
MALPLGLHLEGPFLSLQARGAHPSGAVRPLEKKELLELWEASRGTLKILTLAPEELTPSLMKWLVDWSRDRKKVILSAGHSRATTPQAQHAFDSGFTAVTHAWNAMAFHQREPGILGAALGRKGVHVELIGDGVHVSPEVVRWTCQLHKEICWVSDCTPAAATKRGTESSFGPLRVRQTQDGASRLEDGSLAGGGQLLPEALRAWVESEVRQLPPRDLPKKAPGLLRQYLRYACAEPLRALQSPWKGPRPQRLRWTLSNERVQYELQ